ncbi:MAG TPA: ChbG/HpnK family deacetylase [Acidimicrobiales bacterium]|nr:ChbG/HpnK family deacetylase [Acidimicrobiales bacterium]
MTSAAEQLGFDAATSLVIVTADELGFSYASNQGVWRALDHGAATSAGLMVPAPWARAASATHRGQDVGVTLTLNAEHDLYRWGPITHAPSLLDGDGGFPRTAADLWDHADVDEVRRECRAQLERAILWGFDVSHLSSHLDAALLRPEFFDVVLELALDYALPLRLPNEDVQGDAGFPFRQLALDEGVVVPDRVLTMRGPSAADLLDVAAALDAGVTEIVLRPAVDTEELRAQTSDYAERIAHLDALCAAAFADALAARKAQRIAWRDLRGLQRAGVHQ